MSFEHPNEWYDCIRGDLWNNLLIICAIFGGFLVFLEVLYVGTNIYAYGPQIWEDYVWNHIGPVRKDSTIMNDTEPDVTQMSTLQPSLSSNRVPPVSTQKTASLPKMTTSKKKK